MKRITTLVLALSLLSTLSTASLVRAQGPEMVPGHPPVAGGSARVGPRNPLDAPLLATARPSPSVPPGMVRVTVVDAEERPVEGATVVLGTMGQGGERARVSGLTGADGTYVWEGLSTGQSQAYRVTVPFEGATYSALPFQLPPDQGYDVWVLRLPVTYDERALLQLVGQTFVDIRDERLHVIQQVQLANMSQTPQTYVFPPDGVQIPLPEGYLAFQTQPTMTDQRIEEVPGEGLRIRGSLPPGRVTLTWAFDLPISGREMDVRLSIPFRTYIYRVIAEAAPGMTLDVAGMPPVQTFEDRGRSLFGTEVQRRPGDPPLESITLRFRGIPGPGPMRWYAVWIALGLVAAGAALAIRGGSVRELEAASRERRKKELLDEMVELEREHAAGEVGPQYRQSRRDAIVRELAVLLHQEQSRARAEAGPGASQKRSA